MTAAEIFLIIARLIQVPAFLLLGYAAYFGIFFREYPYSRTALGLGCFMLAVAFFADLFSGYISDLIIPFAWVKAWGALLYTLGTLGVFRREILYTLRHTRWR